MTTQLTQPVYFAVYTASPSSPTQSDISSRNLSHTALTCTNFDFSSLTHLTCVCGILIGLRSAGEHPVRLLSKCCTAVRAQRCDLMMRCTFPSCNRIYGISEVSRGARAAVFRLDRYVWTQCQARPCPLMTRFRELARVQ